MNLAFTLCSLNYLAHAKTVFESIKKTNPKWLFVVGLVDKNTTNIDLSFLDCSVIEVEEIAIDGFTEMVKKYTFIELLTSVKPYYFSWLFNNYPEVNNITYFDSDIMIFHPLNKLEESLQVFDIILTPHYTEPINDNFLPTELHVMQTGIFNLGFIAIRRSVNSNLMLQWWKSRLKDQCIIDLTRGLFVDQLWANLIPIYFDKVLIEKCPGYNMAHWNLHERFLEYDEHGCLVNNEPLIFYHFSHYNPIFPNGIAAHHNRCNFETRKDLRKIYDEYRESLIKYHYSQFKKIACYYTNNEKSKMRRKGLENFLRQVLPDKIKGKLKRAFLK